MRYEKAFQISPDSDFGKRYQAARDQKITFRTLAKYFANKHFGTEAMKFFYSKTLYCDKETPGQICKEKSQGLWRYKKGSDLQKAWESEVISKIDFNALDWLIVWHWDYIDRGSYSLWDYSGMIYGILEDTAKMPKIPEGAKEIKCSEYYRILEEVEEKEKEYESQALGE